MDLEPALRQHRDTQLYFRGDSHWNAQGAFYAAQAITNRLRQRVPTVGVLRREDYTLQTRPIEGGDLVRMLALDVKVSDQDFQYLRRTPAARNNRDPPAPHLGAARLPATAKGSAVRRFVRRRTGAAARRRVLAAALLQIVRGAVVRPHARSQRRSHRKAGRRDPAWPLSATCRRSAYSKLFR